LNPSSNLLRVPKNPERPTHIEKARLSHDTELLRAAQRRSVERRRINVTVQREKVEQEKDRLDSVNDFARVEKELKEEVEYWENYLASNGVPEEDISEVEVLEYLTDLHERIALLKEGTL